MSESVSILIVDDFPTMRRILKRFLTQLSYTRILEAENGKEAWDLLNEESVDAVICDWDMPEMNGAELLQKIRSSPDHSRLPFIMATADEKGEDLVHAEPDQRTAYMPKPFKAVDIGRHLSQVLNQ